MKKIILLLFILAATINVKATHLMGGEITWECIKVGPDAGKYIFNVKVYRDCQGIPIDTIMNLDAHNVPGISTIPLLYLGANDLSPLCNTINGPNTPFSCGGINTQTGNGVGAVEEHNYQSDPIEINGTPDANGWHFTWSSCCRNNAITNLSNPGANGFTLRAVMYSYTDSLGNVSPSGGLCFDSSPMFFEKPRTILEVGNGYDSLAFTNGFTYSHNAFDEDQDSLSYDWGMPLSDNAYDFTNPSSTALSFVSGYSFTNPINGIVMNNATGRTYYPANSQGNYVTCTKVSSYKCGQIISETFREIQIVIVPQTCNLGDTTNGNFGADTLCNVRPQVQPPFFYPASPMPFQWDTMVHCGDTVRFNFLANDYDFYPNGARQDLKFEVSGGQFYNYNLGVPCQNPPCATFEELSTGNTPPFISSGGTGEGYFEWITSCNHVINNCGGDLRPSLYSFVIKVQDDFCPAPAIENTSQVISIYVCPPCTQMKVNPTSTAATCSLPDGTISIAPSGGFPPYNAYYFDMNGIPVNPNSVFAGDYQVRVVDSSQCESIDTITVSGPLPLSFSITNTNATCNGLNDASANVAVQTGNSPYSYLWSNGDTTQNIVSLLAGSYSVLVTDVNGCSLSDTILITEPTVLIVDSANTSNISCFGGNDGSIDISILGGTPLYSYLWSNGSTSEDISSLTTGSYSVVVTDANGCSSTSNSFTITAPNSIQNTAVVTSASCFGSNDGSIDITVGGGTLPYSYLWSNGDTTQNIVSLLAGSYSVLVTDVNGCSLSDTILITEPTVLIVDSANTSNISCFGGNDGSIDISILGGTPLYSYLWSNGSTSEDISSLTTGSYSVVVTDANGCSSTSNSFTITAPNSIQNTAVVTSASCFGSNDGSIDITVGGGLTPYSYLWSNGDLTEDVSGLFSGVYAVQITDNSGCIFIDSIFLGQPQSLSTSMTSISGGGLSGLASGGTLPYTYDFYGPSGLLASSLNNLGTSVIINPAVSGLYTLIVTDLNGCIDSASTYFNLSFSPLVMVSLSNIDCDSLSDLTIEVSQDSGEVDMSTGIFQSTAGAFDIVSMSIGDTIGTATLMAQGGLVMVNTYLMVSNVINANQAIICANDSVLGCVGSFTINNSPGTGIYILTNTIPDGNTYTLGNMSSANFVNCFINPCTPFSFDVTINSELGDVYNESFFFNITSIKDFSSSNLKIYPNPSSGEISFQFNNYRGEVRLVLTDLLGREIYMRNTYYNTFEERISLTHLSKGSYILLIESDGERFSEVIIYK